MVFRKEIHMSGLHFFFLFWVLGLSTDGIGGISVVDKIDDNGGSSTSKKCNFSAVFNFGDSNSDTGGISAAFYAIGSPNGETFFGKPSGRVCDGRLIVDYPIYRDVQISQFRQFKARIIDIVNSIQQEKGKANVPKAEDFSKALYTIDIGQNDLAYGFHYTTERQTRAAIPNIHDLFSTAVHVLYIYKETSIVGICARVFWVHNTGPIGCLPVYNKYYANIPGSLDKNGCVILLNDIAQEFNKQLKSKLTQLKANLTSAAFTYVDAYTDKYNLINSANKVRSSVDPLDFCNGMYGGSCANPLEHISWNSNLNVII
ncbi:hypothetical protein MKX01_007570 [Papaver californicum]|nr:hypothetical protein MKX01_007570 [Papaver californicum]